jgi:hypothetical protein
LSNYSGPTTIRYLLGILETCLIPPGSAAELLTARERLSEALSARAASFLERIRAAAKSPDPSSILGSSPTGEVRNLLLEDLTQFDDDLQEEQMVTALLERSVRAEDVLPPLSNDRNEIEVFKTAYTYLQGRRPKMSLNNFHDSLNAALVVKVFNSSAARGSAKPIPVLVSQTRAVQQLDGLSRNYLRVDPRRDLPSLFADGAFLVISESLRTISDGRYGLIVDHAKELETDCTGLEETTFDLLEASSSIAESGVPEEEITIKHLPTFDWDLLLFRRELFERRWGGIFAPSIMAAQRDRSYYLDLLMSPAIREQLFHDSPAVSRAALERITNDLRNTPPADYALHLQVIGRGETEPIQVPSTAFSLSLIPNDGTLFRDVHPGSPLNDFDRSILDLDHDVKIAAHPRYLSSGAAITVGSFRQGSRRRHLSITWLHAVHPPVVLRECFGLLTALHTETPTIQARFCSARKIVALETSGHDVETLVGRLNECGGTDCVQVTSERGLFFFDTTPLNGVEMQVGFSMPEEFWSPIFLPLLCVVISETSEMPVPPDYVSAVLTPMVQRLEFPSPRPVDK